MIEEHMNKLLEARKCKDGWIVKIERTEIVPHETDVYKIFAENGITAKDITRDKKTGERLVIRGWL